MKTKTIHKELDDLTSENALRALFDVAIDIITRGGKCEIKGEDLPRLFLLGAMIPATNIVQQLDEGEQLEAFKTLAASANKSLEGMGCFVQVQDEKSYNKTTPDSLIQSRREAKQNERVASIIEDFFGDLGKEKAKTKEDELLKMDAISKTVN